jgi:hypothetical protein
MIMILTILEDYNLPKLEICLMTIFARRAIDI